MVKTSYIGVLRRDLKDSGQQVKTRNFRNWYTGTVYSNGVDREEGTFHTSIYMIDLL